MKKKLKGKVISDKMDKTVVVEVKRLVTHPIYKKKYTISKKYHAHDEKNEYKIGDVVEIEETKPISKKKRWRVVKKVKSQK
jgi:small subunit ribosomal protein S17